MRRWLWCVLLLCPFMLSSQVVSLRLFECPEPVAPEEMKMPCGLDIQSGFMDFLFEEGYIATTERSTRSETPQFRPFGGQELEDARNGLIDFVVDAMVTFEPSRFRKELWIPIGLSWRISDVKSGLSLKEGKLEGIKDGAEVSKDAPVSSRKLGRNLAVAVSRLILQGRGE